MSQISNPTILILQDSFQTPDFYAHLHSTLQSHAYPTHHPLLPSCSRVYSIDFPSKTLTDDANAVTDALTMLIEEEQRDVLVVMHGYGGLVGNEAIPRSLTHSHRKELGKKGGVIHLFYYCALVLAVGQCMRDTFEQLPFLAGEECGEGRYCAKDARRTLFNDIGDEEAERWMELLVPQSAGVRETVLKNAAYEFVGSTYLVCEGDGVYEGEGVCSGRIQEGFARRAGARAVRCGAGHMPHISWTEGLARMIVGVAERVMGQLGEGS